MSLTDDCPVIVRQEQNCSLAAGWHLQVPAYLSWEVTESNEPANVGYPEGRTGWNGQSTPDLIAVGAFGRSHPLGELQDWVRTFDKIK